MKTTNRSPPVKMIAKWPTHFLLLKQFPSISLWWVDLFSSLPFIHPVYRSLLLCTTSATPLTSFDSIRNTIAVLREREQSGRNISMNKSGIDGNDWHHWEPTWSRIERWTRRLEWSKTTMPVLTESTGTSRSLRGKLFFFSLEQRVKTVFEVYYSLCAASISNAVCIFIAVV